MTSTPHGLTAAQVAERVARGETNAFKARVARSYWEIFRDNVLNLFNVVLFTLLVIVWTFQDYGTVIFAGASVVTNTFLGMLQEMDAKRKLDRLAALAARDVKVYRDGRLQQIHSSQIVKDDVLVIEPGDRLVVDGSVLLSDALEMDESHLTGESDAILKNENDHVYSGAFCSAGSGIMVARQVGRDSTINKLSSIAKVYKRVLTPTQERIVAVVEITVLLMAIMGPMVLLAGFVNNEPLLNILRNSVVFVTSLVPQGLVLVAILSLTLGALSISRFQTLIQRVNAVESMAYVSVLCLDKTGTITRNHLTVREVLPLDGVQGDRLHAVLRTFTRHLSHRNRTAAAIDEFVERADARDIVKTKEIPFNSARKWSAVSYQNGSGIESLVLGAPERLLPADHPAQARALQLAREGLRVVAFGRAAGVPDSGEARLSCDPLALVVLSDSVRDDIRETLANFQAQHVQVKIISGDNEETVRAIATQAGLTLADSYTGEQIDRMSDAELEQAAEHGELFARISPDSKRRIVAALRRRGHYVGMVGDGVNDVPALKEANLAIVMNDGAQISKDIADIVLLNNAVSTLPLAFKEGKAITQTIFGTIKLFLVKNFYSLLLFAFAALMALPFPITPVQISWLTFGTVNVPATLIAFQLLRPQHIARFRRDVLDFVVTLGVIGGGAVALIFALFYLLNGHNTAEARSAVTLFLCFYGIQIFWLVMGVDLMQRETLRGRGGLLLLGVALVIFSVLPPYLQPDWFNGFVPPSPLESVLIAAFVLLTIVIGSAALRYRYLLNKFWMLAQKDRESAV